MNVSLLYTLDVSHSTGGNPVRSSILWVKAGARRPVWFHPLKLTFPNNSRSPGQWVTLTYEIGISPIIVKKNKLTNFTASISEVVRGLFLPPTKLRPQKHVTMFTNRKRVYITRARVQMLILEYLHDCKCDLVCLLKYQIIVDCTK